jgi:hypothetical protein
LEKTETAGSGGHLDYAAGSFRVGDDALNRQYRAILSFDTSALPDTAIIYSAILKIKGAGLVGSDPFGTHGALLVDIRTGAFMSNPALQFTDFAGLATQSNLMSFNRIPVNSWNNALPLSASFGRFNRTGLTQFRLRFAKEDNDDLGADYRVFYSGDSAYKPALWLTYRP